jgi:hypothetical protein
VGPAAAGDGHADIQGVAKGEPGRTVIGEIKASSCDTIVVGTVRRSREARAESRAICLTGNELEAVSADVGVEAAGRSSDAPKLLGAPGASSGAVANVVQAVPLASASLGVRVAGASGGAITGVGLESGAETGYVSSGTAPGSLLAGTENWAPIVAHGANACVSDAVIVLGTHCG